MLTITHTFNYIIYIMFKNKYTFIIIKFLFNGSYYFGYEKSCESFVVVIIYKVENVCPAICLNSSKPLFILCYWIIFWNDFLQFV